MKDPLVAPFILLAAGILVSHFIRFEPRETLVALAAFAGLAALSYSRQVRWLTLLCGVLTLLAAGILDDVLHRPAAKPELDAGAREVVILDGCIVEPSTLYENREQFTLRLAPDARARVSLNFREGEQAPDLRYGQRVEIEARVRPPPNFHNPGSFDYAGYLARKDIYWTASVPHGGKIAVLPGRCGSRFQAVIFALRVAALQRIDWLYAGSPYATGMMEATLIGDTTKLEKIWTDHFRRTGTYHVLVISGLHISVVAASLLFLLRVCMFPELPALAAAGAVAWLYALVAGGAAPALRAASGFTFYLVGRYFFRQRRLMNLLAAVAAGFLLVDPAELFDASFQLSFLSIAAIGALAVPLFEATSGLYSRALRHLRDRDFDLRLPPRVARFRVELRLLAETILLWTGLRERWTLPAAALFLRVAFFVYDLAVLSAVFQIGLALPMTVYFHRVSFSGISANILIVPLMTAVIPIGFVAILAGWQWLAALANALLTASEAIANWHASWEPPWRTLDPPLWLGIAFVASLLLLTWTIRVSRRWRWPSLALVLALFVLLLWQPRPPELARGKLELTVIDVGQGDSLFVAFPDGKLMIVDGGGIPVFGKMPKPRLDIGEDVVSPYLWSRGIRRVDTIVLTHAHDDHAGGIPALLENFRPRELWTGSTPESDSWRKIVREARRIGVKIIPMDSGRSLAFGGTHIDVLSPPDGYVPSATPKNNDSLVFRISFGAQSFLLTGDMEKQMETRLVTEGLLTHADVLKVGHHGSRTSTTAPFLNLVRPEIAIVSVGADNLFRLPNPDVIEHLGEGHAEVLRTDQCGLITVVSDGRHLKVDTMLWSGPKAHPMSAF
ncbi:MAG: ComEC/Rec2 family competence protein [Bryobacteraceae bacterium]